MGLLDSEKGGEGGEICSLPFFAFYACFRNYGIPVKVKLVYNTCMTQGFANTLKARRNKGKSSDHQTTSVNSNPVSIAAGLTKIVGGLRRPSQNDGWSRGYDGPGKGTW